MGCHFLLQCMKVKSESEIAQSCPTLSDPMDCSLPGFIYGGLVAVVSDSLRLHRLLPTRLLCPWDFPGKSTGVCCHCLLHFPEASVQFSRSVESDSLRHHESQHARPPCPSPTPQGGKRRSQIGENDKLFFFSTLLCLQLGTVQSLSCV